MYFVFIIIMYDPISDFYSKPQIGSGIAIFWGSRRQTGGGIFASIQRFAIPILRRIGQKLLSIAPTVGKKAMEVVQDTITDVRSGRKHVGGALKSNISKHSKAALQYYGINVPEEEEKQTGSGYKRKSPRGYKRKSPPKKKTPIRKTRNRAITKKHHDIFATK